MNLSSTELKVIEQIAKNNKSINLIAKSIKKSNKQVYRAVKKLKKIGFIEYSNKVIEPVKSVYGNLLQQLILEYPSLISPLSNSGISIFTSILEPKCIKEIAIKNSQAVLLTTIYGVAEIRAMEIITEIGDVNRFESANKLCSYAGLIPGIKQSGTTIRFGRLVKQANRNLKDVFIQTSWNLIRPKEGNRFREFYLMLSKKKGKQKAICAVARKLCCVVYAMLRKNQEFMLL